MKLSLVIPCYNEAGNVRLFFEETKKAFESDGSGSIRPEEYELIFVNDGSKDDTLKELRELYESEKNYHIKVISFSRNFGKEAAIYAGLKHSVGEYISIIDADLQQPPELVLNMMKQLDENPEVDCVATYQEQRKEGKFLSFYKKIFYKLINKISEIDFVSGASDFRTFKRCVAEAILDMPEYFRFSKGIFSWVGFEVLYMPYTAEERVNGESKWSFAKLFKYAIEGIVSFTTTPLRFATFLGAISSILSGIYLIVIVIQKLAFSVDVPGYTTIVALILLIGGIQLLVLGIIGEYLARMYVQGKNRPIYIAKEILTYESYKKEIPLEK